MCWCMPLIPALRRQGQRQGQADRSGFEASLVYTEKACFEKLKILLLILLLLLLLLLLIIIMMGKWGRSQIPRFFFKVTLSKTVWYWYINKHSDHRME